MQDIGALAGNSTLLSRINTTVQAAPRCDHEHVLYLPTVCLRGKHNPAFALACTLANHLGLPLVVLALVLDDTHWQHPLGKVIRGV